MRGMNTSAFDGRRARARRFNAVERETLRWFGSVESVHPADPVPKITNRYREALRSGGIRSRAMAPYTPPCVALVVYQPPVTALALIP